ncbi:MAG: DUF2604 domain-containing protein [Bacteroidetes bacterium]|nr:DUF2604 domain-containing protein [Bacteroidota bacterium]
MTNNLSSKDKTNSGNDEFYTLIFVIEGNPITLEFNVTWILRQVIEMALEKSRNTGRPVDDWQVKLGDTVLDMTQPLCNLGLSDGTKLYLSTKIGAGGN